MEKEALNLVIGIFLFLSNLTMKHSIFKCRCGYIAENLIMLFNHSISCDSNKKLWKGHIHNNYKKIG